MRALVLTQERAEALGYQGEGPFTFAGAFPGEYLVGQPLALRYLGFDNEDEAEEAFETAFADHDDDQVPLELTDVDDDEGLPLRTNHALSEGDPALAAAAVAEAEAKAGVKKIRTHAAADAVADELGITFPDDATVAQKVTAIEQFHAGGDPDHMTPAPGAEDTVPVTETPEVPA